MDYKEINKKSWNQKTKIHLDSDFYDNDNFKKGKNSLNEIELGLLGDLKGKSVLHLQCHFGQDTISFDRLGATSVGVDLSDEAIRTAESLAQELDSSATFVCCDIYDLPNHLDQKFDIVFTSYGTIGWLPDMDRWASVVAQFLKPEGQFLIVEFHPAVWMFDDDFNEVKYNYFNEGPIHEVESGTYAKEDAEITQEYVMWNHSISEVVNSLIKKDLIIDGIHEYNYSPYPCFRGTKQVGERQYIIEKMGNKLPLVYAIQAHMKV